MTLAEILAFVTDAEVLSAMRAAYPEEPDCNMRGYAEKVLPTLRTTNPKPREDGMKIALTYRKATHQDGFYVDVSGDVGNGPEFGIEFTPWADWLGMEVEVHNADMTPALMVAHCIWEMTWAGFDPSVIQDHLEEINDAASDLEAKLDSLGENPTEEDYASIGLTPVKPEDFK